MKEAMKKQVKKPNRAFQRNVISATSSILENLENRMMMSTTITNWNFENYTAASTVVTSPTPAVGTGTANSIGMQTSGTYGTSGAAGNADISFILDGALNNGAGDYSSTGASDSGNAWKVVGSTGWSSAAAIGSQGAQFMVSTVGDTGISLKFDLDASSVKPPAQFQVEYTTDGSTWINASAISAGTGSNGSTDGLQVLTNTTNPNIVTGSYFQFANNSDGLLWQNNITADFSGISAANNDANFGVRIVNAATGSSETELNGTPYVAATGGNWRYDNVRVIASGSALAAAVVSTNPTNQNVSAGQPVTFTAAAAGNPTPTVQWFKGTPGSGTLIPGATSPTYTFTTSSTASDNGNTYYAEFTNTTSQTNVVDTTAATLTDTLAAPVVTTQPSVFSTTAGNTATFTAVATGSPVPTVEWQSSPDNATWSNYSAGVTTNTANSSSSTLSFTTTISQNNTYFRAVFINSQATAGVASSGAKLSVAGATIAAWNFNNLTTGQYTTSPAASTGTASDIASSIGMSAGPAVWIGTNTTGTYTLTVNDSSGSYTTAALPAADTAAQVQTALRGLGATGAASFTATAASGNNAVAFEIGLSSDPSATLFGNGTSLGTPAQFIVQSSAPYAATGASGPDLSAADATAGSSDTVGFDWKIVGENGWNTSAGIGSQGAQFLVPTTGFQSIGLKFDWGVSSAKSVGELAVEYTLDDSVASPSWVVAPAGSLSIPSADTNTALVTNSTSSNIINGSYFFNLASATWQDGLSVDFSGISGANNDPNFGIRLVNAATGASGTGASGTAVTITAASESSNTVTVSASGTYVAGQTVTISGVSPAAFDGTYVVTTVGTGSFSYTDSTSGLGTGTSSGAKVTPYSAPSNTSTNWRFDEVQITGANIPVAPAVTTQPTAQSVVVGSPVTFTAVASGFPTPTVQWYSGNTSNPTLIAGATSSTYTFTPTAAQNGTTYFAIFTNSLSTATTNVVGLTVNSAPTITTQPTTQNASAGATATFTAAANGYPTPSVQWQSSTDGVTFNNISGATSTTYTVTASSANAGLEYRAVFTNSTGTVTTNTVQLNVLGSAFAQWIFNGVVPETIETSLSDSSLISGAPGSGDAPLPTLTNNPYNSSNGQGDIAQTLGLFNNYTGVQVESGADIGHYAQSGVNPSFNPYSWRIRSNHTETGWSQLAPQLTTDSAGDDPQGVLFRVNTTGYTDITLHFDWSGGGIADMQPQYSPDGGHTWINAGGILQNFSKDYPGITATTTPPGFTVSLEGSAYPAAGQPNSPFNNPNFQLRLMAAYDPNLPLISDGNNLIPTVHGQYADATAGAQNAVQVLDVGGLPTSGANFFNVSGGTYQLSYGGQVTAPIAYNATPATVQADLDALSTIGGVGGTVTVADYLITPNTTASANDDFLGITFGGTLGDQVVPTLSVLNNTLTGSSPTATVATWIPGAAAAGIGSNGYEVGVTRFQDSNAQTGANGGSWELSDFSFNGLATSGAPTIVTQPSSETVIGGTSATFTAVDYTESTPVTAQWQINTGSGWSNITGATNFSVNTSTYTFTTNTNLSDTGHQFRVIFTNPSGSTTSFAATLTVVAPVAPSVTLQPTADAVQVGNYAQFTATATGSPSPTVQWQVNSGSGWSNVVNNGVSITGATSTTLYILSNSSQIGSSYQYRAVFTNLVSTATTNAATLTVLAAETVTTDWNFASHAIGYDNSPAPSIGSGTATALGFTIPFDYAGQADGASGTSAPGAVNADDVTSTSGAANPSYTENTWRIRGGPSATAGGAPYNGWSNLAKEYTQGAQFSASTVGYGSIYVTMDVYTTTSGELNARQQYTLDGINWYNLDDQQLAYNGSTNPATGLDDLDPSDPYGPLNLFSNDFYGATATYDTTTISSVSLTNNVVTVIDNNDYQVGQTVNVKGIAAPNASLNGIFTITAASATSFSYNFVGANVAATSQTAAAANLGGFIVPLVFNLTGIAGVANNPNFGIRLVNAYNPSLAPISSTLIGDSGPTTHGQYAVASSIGNPTPYQGAAGNWRFDNIVFHGVALAPSWFNPGTSTYTWNATTQVLTVTAGSGSITSDPLGTNSPTINVSGLGTSLQVTTTAHVNALNISGGAVVSMNTSGSAALVLTSGTSLSIDSSSKLDLGTDFLDLQASSKSAGQTLLNTIESSLISFGNATSGITSSENLGILGSIGAIENNGSTGVLYGSGGSILSTFGGVSPGANDVLIRETYLGDANLDGVVNSVDYGFIDAGFLAGGSGQIWASGDFNHDGVVNGSDYTLIDNAFNTQGSQLSAATQIAKPSALFAGGSPFAASATSEIASISNVADLLSKDQSDILSSSQDVVDALNA